MKELVNIVGGFPKDKQKEIQANIDILLKQPKLKVFETYANKNPRFKYKQVILCGKKDKIKYFVMDMGYAEGVAGTTSIGSQVYFEDDIKKLK